MGVQGFLFLQKVAPAVWELLPGAVGILEDARPGQRSGPRPGRGIHDSNCGGRAARGGRCPRADAEASSAWAATQELRESGSGARPVGFLFETNAADLRENIRANERRWVIPARACYVG